jgi:hypothetical protein
MNMRKLIALFLSFGLFLSSASPALAVGAFLSAGGYVVGPVGACLQLDGGVGELFHLIPDGRIPPLIPPDYIWSPTTITIPVVGRPPAVGQYVLGLVYPNFGQGICIKTTFPFFAVGGWKFYYIGESVSPTVPGATAAVGAAAVAGSSALLTAGIIVGGAALIGAAAALSSKK